MNTLLQVNQLSVSFHQGQSNTHIVKNVSFDVYHNETLALVGESGSGKSLTAHSIMRLLPYPVAYHPSGEILFDDEDLLTLPLNTMTSIRGRKIGMIFQEPMSALNPLHTIEKQIAEVLRIHQVVPKKHIKEKVIELLKQVHITDAEEKLTSYPHELSGGQRQRVMIAMALANQPELLIADEPTTALDVTVQKEILDLLKELQTQYKMSILLITHDLGVVKYMADRILVMNQGEIVESGQTQNILEQPKNTYTQLLIDSHPSGEPVAIKKQTTSEEAVTHTISTKSLSVSFPKNKPLFGRCTDFFHALRNINLSIESGSTLGILGESGSGKSTLALAMLRLIQSEGKILLDNQSISDLTEKELRPLRRKMQMIFQDPFASLSPRMSVKQIISEGLHLYGKMDIDEIDRKVDEIMQEVGLDPATKNRYPHEFSGGQRQRIAIARALIINPKVVFLDEPTSALDRAVQMQVIDLLRKLQKERQLTYVFISHDIHVIKALSHNIIVIKNGEIVEEGEAKSVLNKPSHPYTQQLLSAALT